jgi:GMP synthase (glutamine-hydrolysing)
MGGRVDYHPLGEEIGTVEIHLLDGSAGAPLFGSFPPFFFAHTAHSQPVLSLPPDAVPLAANAHEPHHAFRLGDRRVWGLQFHPEYDETIMRLYIMTQSGELIKEGRDVLELMVEVSETPFAAKTLTNFAQIALERQTATPL